MSKPPKRKITVNINPKTKVLPKTRPSVFERLGTKANASYKDFCHHWAQQGTCPYGKGCKYSSTHTLISPSKKRAAKKENETKKRHCKSNTRKREHDANPKATKSPDEDWNRWDPNDLEDADPDDLEKRRQELHRQLELQMKIEKKARKKGKGANRESSSSGSSSSSSDSSSSSEDTSSTSSTSVEESRKKKVKKHDSSSSTDAEQVQKPKVKNSKIIEKAKKPLPPGKPLLTITVRSPSPAQIMNSSQTPPPKLKPFIPVDKIPPRSKSPPRSIDQKEKHPSPKISKTYTKDKEKEKELEREKILREREREKEKEREREREKEKEREREKERIREKEKERLREKEKERERERIREREIEREKELERKKREARSPRHISRSTKDAKKRETPDSRDRKQSPSRSRGSGSGSSRRDNSRKNSPTPYKDDRVSDKRDNDRFRDKGRSNDRGRRDRHDSRERDRERERQEREAAREKEREEALARCQERQRERERLKEIQRKEEEQRNRDRNRRDNHRGLEKPTGDRVERLLPLQSDRAPPNRRGNSRDRGRDQNRVNRRDRSPPIHNRSRSRKPNVNRDNRPERDIPERVYDGGFRNKRDFNRDRSRELPHIHDIGRRNDGSPFDRNRHNDRHYHELDERYNENSRDERLSLDARDYPDDRRPHREMWDVNRDVEHDREPDQQRRYGREGSHPPSLKDRDWDAEDYPEHDWERGRRPLDWDGRNWETREQDPPHLEDEWRHYGRSMDSWAGDDSRRRWPDWQDKSRPRSTASHHPDDVEPEVQKRELLEHEFIESHVEVETAKEMKVESKPNIQPLSDTSAEIKTASINDTVEDNFSEISDDADEILNREEEIAMEVLPDTSKSSDNKVQSTKVPDENSTQSVETESQSVSLNIADNSSSPGVIIPPTVNKEDSLEEENIDLDFEEISEDELEEETKIKGLGDVLGVDWASLVAESRPRAKPISSAKRRWESHNVLVNLGISVEMAGEDVVKSILKEHTIAKQNEEKESTGINSGTENLLEQNTECNKEIEISHPIAAIQVAIREKEATRRSLFASAGPYRRALSARRDLEIRRHLCNLPANDIYVETPKHNPEIFQAALELFERSL